MTEVLEGELMGADEEIPTAVEPKEPSTISGTSLGAVGGLALGGLFASQKPGASAGERVSRGAVGALFGALAGATLGALVDALTKPKSDPDSADSGPAQDEQHDL